MSTKVRLATPDMTVGELAPRLIQWRVSGVPVVDSDLIVVGVVSLSDLTASASGVHPLRGAGLEFYQDLWLPESDVPITFADPSIRVSRVMNKDVISIHPDCGLDEAANLILEHRVHRLVVVNPDPRSVVGVLSTYDLTRALVDSYVDTP